MEQVNLESIKELVDSVAQDVNDSSLNQSLENPIRTMDDYMKIEDSFVRFREMLEDAIALYERARLTASVSDTGLSASIYRMAEPFRKGFFTLAVVGKMSSGKSTFVNALLGDKDLLPTGFFQTTCTLTSIQHSETKKLKVVYGNGSEKEYSENISESLKDLVAIPDEYKNLPVNNVNRMIISDMSVDEICSDEWVRKLEQLARQKIDVDNLRKYVDTHPKDIIPTAVAIECPLNKNYQGWRIVDTPGVDAIGGIEDDTKRFLCGSDDDGNHNVDAIIFVQKAQANIEDLHLNEFVSKTMDTLTEEAKQRTFFVLTHGADPSFLRNKTEIMDVAKRLFVNYTKVGINGERLIALDSLASLLEADSSLDLESLIMDGQPQHWNPKEWDICRDMLGQIEFMLRRKKTEVNNENLRRELRELAHFEKFRSMLDDFVQEEKLSSFTTIINLIDEDITQCISVKEKEISILKNNLGKEPDEFMADLAKEKELLDDFQQQANDKIREIRNTFSKTHVDGIFEQKVLKEISLDTFKSLSSTYEMRRKAEELGSKAKEVEKSIIERIREEVKGFIDTTQLQLNIALPAIDMRQIEYEAREKSTTYETVRIRGEKKSGFLGGLGRLFGTLFDNDWGYEMVEEIIPKTDLEKEHQQAAQLVFKFLKDNLDRYQQNVYRELKLISDNIDSQIKEMIKNRKDSYDKLAEGTSIVDQIVKIEGELESLKVALHRLEIYK